MFNKKIYFKLPLLLLFIVFTVVIIKCGKEADDASDDGMLCQEGEVAVRFNNATTDTDNIDYRLYSLENCKSNIDNPYRWNKRWEGLYHDETSLYACVPAKNYYIWSWVQGNSQVSCTEEPTTFTAGYKYRIIEDDSGDFTVDDSGGSFKTLRVRGRLRKIRVEKDDSGNGIEAQKTRY